jgi:PTS system nitrogen regulatory IIA component
MNVGATLRLLRTDAGLSLRQLAARIGVSSAYLSRVENGHDAPPTGERLAAIARELELPLDFLVEVGERLPPSLEAYLRESPAARRLCGELVRRRLGARELERVRRFVETEFPSADDPPRSLPTLAALLKPGHVVLQLSCSDLEDALDVAAARLVTRGERPSARELAADLLAREGEATTSVGQGVAIPRTFVSGGPPRLAVITLARSLRLTAPDGLPVRTLFVMVSPDRGLEHIARMAQVARLANRGISDALASARTAPEAIRRIASLEETL